MIAPSKHPTTRYTRKHGFRGVKRIAMTLRVPLDVHNTIKAQAMRHNMTLNDYVLTLIAQHT